MNRMSVCNFKRAGSAFVLACCFAANSFGQSATALKYIDPNIGGVGQLLQPTRPNIQQPNQMMRMLPIRADFLDDQISDFAMLVPSHRLGQVFSLKPNNDASITEGGWKKKMAYDQTNEQNIPWHYSTYLLDAEITTEFTPGIKTGIFRFTFPANTPKRLYFGAYTDFNATWKFNGKEITAEQLYKADEGHKNVPVYLYGEFSELPATGKIENGKVVSAKEISGKQARAFAEFKTPSNKIELRYAVSFVSAEQAKKNFDNELKDNTGFDAMVARAKKSWEDVIGKINVVGGTEKQKRSFYTALYRSMERMVDVTEDGKYYSGYDGKVHSDSRPFYVDDWVWDSYHAHHPLRMILNPKQEEDMLQSYVRMYQQSGWMPTFPVVGQYSMGNEPSLFIPYLYNYTSSPWKTQNKIRLLLQTWFDDNIFGIPGDEDGGGLSAFVVFSAMGFYPVTPGVPEYAIGSPLFEKITIDLPNNKKFTVIAHNNSERNKYVQSAKVNGKVLNKPFFSHQDLANGGTLELVMGDKPNKAWGK